MRKRHAKDVAFVAVSLLWLRSVKTSIITESFHVRVRATFVSISTFENKRYGILLRTRFGQAFAYAGDLPTKNVEPSEDKATHETPCL